MNRIFTSAGDSVTETLSARLKLVIRYLGYWCALLLLLISCAPVFETTTPAPAFQGPLTPRPTGTPDVLIISFSGRCPCFNVPNDNVDYLKARGTTQEVASVFEARGLKVMSVGASGHLTRHLPLAVHNEQLGVGVALAPPQDGFLQMEALLTKTYQTWMYGRSNPTRIVLLGHSHGVVWTHALSRAHPEIPISVMIDLDGSCAFWEFDHRRIIQVYVRSLGQNPWPFDLASSCSSVQVGHFRYDVKDVVYPNVLLDLEVQTRPVAHHPDGSTEFNIPYDQLSNIRPDGSHTGIQTWHFDSETHTSVTLPNQPALTAVRASLAEWLDASSEASVGADTEPQSALSNH